MIPDGRERPECVTRHFFASIVRFPDRHGPIPPGSFPGKVDKICGGHGQGETPGPIPNPEAKALHGDGTAPERVWESSAPPLSHDTVPPVEPPRAPGGILVFPPTHARAGPTAGRTGREKRGRRRSVVHVPFLSWIAVGGTRCIHQVRE